MAREAVWGLDMMTRLSFLEGVAGVAPGSWLRRGKRGMLLAKEYLGPDLSPLWTTPKNQRLYLYALKVADKKLGGVLDVTGEDLLQEIMSASATMSAPKRKRVFYSAGEAVRRDLPGVREGRITPKSPVVMGSIRNWVQRAAIDEARKWNRRKDRHTFSEVPEPADQGPTMLSQRGGTSELRDKLVLMALQSPGGPGLEIRKIIDDKISQAFPKNAQTIVRMFFQKIGDSRFRSQVRMREILGENFKPQKWFTQALRLVRKEIQEELDVTPQRLTNVLGSGASRVFKFLRDQVGRDPRVKSVLSQLSNQVDVLEPGVFRLAGERESRRETVVRMLKDMEHMGGIESGNAFANLLEFFEMNEHKDWSEQVGPHVVYNKGPSTLRVASFWLKARRDESFEEWVEQRTFRSPKTNEQIQFKSLPPEDQAKIRSQWDQSKEQEEKQPGSGRGQQEQWESPKKQLEQEAFTRWLGDTDPENMKAWSEGDDKAKREVLQKFKSERGKKETTRQRMERDKRDERFKSWIQDQDSETQKAWESGDRKKMVEVRQQFSQKERKEEKDREEKSEREHKERKEKSRIPAKKLMSMPKNQRPNRWVDSDNGNRLYGSSAEVSEDSKVSESNIAGSVEGGSTVSGSSVGQGSRVSGGSSIRGSSIEGKSVVEDSSSLEGVKVSRGARVRGGSDIKNAQLAGGTWDGVSFDGKGGTFHDSYDSDTLSALTSIDTPSPGPGDGPLMAMTRYLQDGGRTKKFLGGEMDRAKLSKRIQKHVYNNYDKDDPWMGRGASFLERFSNEDFDKLMETAKKRADDKGSQGKKKAMLYQLTKTALENPELRSQLMPLIKMGRDAKQASETVDLRGRVIRAAYETSDRNLREALVKCVVAAGEESLKWEEDSRGPVVGSVDMSLQEYNHLVRVAFTTSDTNRRVQILGILKQAKYGKSFLKWVETRQFKNPQTGNDVKFVSLPSEEQAKIYEQWKQNRLQTAQKFKPQGLSDETRLTPKRFDDVEEGDMIWVSWSPKMLHKVTGKGETKKNKKPYLSVVITNPQTGEELEKRYLYRSSTQNPDHELHVVPKQTEETAEEPKEDKAPAKSKEDAEPQKMIDINDEMLDQLEKIEKGKAKVTEQVEGPMAEALIESMNANASQWLEKPGMPGKGAFLSDEKGPYAAGSEIEITQGGYSPKKYTVLSEGLVKGPKGAAMLVTSDSHGPTLIPIANDYEPKNMKLVSEPEKAPEKAPEKPKTPKGEKYKDRKKLKGKPRPDDASVYMSKEDRELFIPDGLSDTEVKKIEDQMKKANVGLLRKLKSNANKAVDDPEGKYAQAMKEAGYGEDQLKKMQEWLNKKLRLAEGRTYAPEVLEIWNKYDLEEVDADELYNFKVDKPPFGKKISPEELKQKFLAKAAPETRERMKDMPIDDFMAAYKSILDADEEEELEA